MGFELSKDGDQTFVIQLFTTVWTAVAISNIGRPNIAYVFGFVSRYMKMQREFHSSWHLRTTEIVHPNFSIRINNTISV